MSDDTSGTPRNQPGAAPDASPAGKPARRRRRTSAASANGRPSASTPPPATPPDGNGQPDRDAALLKDAVANPGGDSIPEEPLTTGGADIEIPSESISPAAEPRGRRIDNDPATMVVALSKPTPNSWIQLFPDHVFDTVMYAYQPQRNQSPTYYYIEKSLRSVLRQNRFKNVRVHLVYDTNGEGEAFLWLLPLSDRSPYLAAVTEALSHGPKYVADNLFNFDYTFGQSKVHLSAEPRKPTDPVAVLPARPLGRLLREAMGDRYVATTGHPMWPVFTMGRRLS
jgi:hypothetical protein